MKSIDLRSDTVTQPTTAMREAMLSAPLGDDVYGEDPTVNAFQARLAARLGFAAGLFVPTGTQSNLIALMAHCERGDEYIVGMEAHTYKYEGGGAAVLGSIQPQPIPQEADGTLSLEKVAAAIKPIDPHFARSKLLCLENTWHGRALPLDYLRRARAFCERNELSLHLDGARLFNAATALNVDVKEITKHFHSVSVCFSKGLGAPVGSVLLGEHAFIERAKRWRKVTGGGWRQAGMLAAACNYALDHHVDRLKQDHDRARTLADGLGKLPTLKVTANHSNMVFIEVPVEQLDGFKAHIQQHKINMSIGYLPTIRMVTHLDISDADIERTISVFEGFFGKS